MTARLLDLPEVVELSGHGYLVKSASHFGYLLLVRGTECSCPAGQNGAQDCRHRRAVRLHCNEIDQANRRPSAPVHSALLDN